MWWDRTLKPGENYQKVIPSVLRNARCVIVLWSKDSVDSEWVLDEANVAKQRQVLAPARLDDVEIPFGFGRIHTAPLIGWTGAEASPEFEELIQTGAIRPNDHAAPRVDAHTLEVFRIVQRRKHAVKMGRTPKSMEPSLPSSNRTNSR